MSALHYTKTTKKERSTFFSSPLICTENIFKEDSCKNQNVLLQSLNLTVNKRLRKWVRNFERERKFKTESLDHISNVCFLSFFIINYLKDGIVHFLLKSPHELNVFMSVAESINSIEKETKRSDLNLASFLTSMCTLDLIHNIKES